MVPIAFTHLRRFGTQPKRLLRRRRLEQAECALVVAVHAPFGGKTRKLIRVFVQRGLKLNTSLEPVSADVCRKCQRRDREIRPGRIAVYEERSMTLAEETRTLSGDFAAIAVVKHRG